jgi:hypothetical protein
VDRREYDSGQDSEYHQVDTGPEPADFGDRIQLVHRDTAEFHLNRIASWLRV